MIMILTIIITYLIGVVLAWVLVATINDTKNTDNKAGFGFCLLSFIAVLICLIGFISIFLVNIDKHKPTLKFFKKKNKFNNTSQMQKL